MDKETIRFEAVLRSLKEAGACAGVVEPEAYHAWKPMLEEALGCPVVSKSTLAEFARGAFKFKWARDHKIEKKSASMALGSLVDCLTLTPELFDTQYLCEEKQVAVKKDGTPYSNGQQDAEQKRRWEAAAEEGVTVICREQLAQGEAIAAQAVSHLERYGLRRDETFLSQYAVWVYMTEMDGVELACPVVVTGMFDIFPTDEKLGIWDLKTTSEDVFNYERLCYSMEDWKYGMQAAMYLDLNNAVNDGQRDVFRFLFVGTSEPYMSRVVGMDSQVVDLYREEYRRLLKAYCMAWKMDDWGEPMLDMRWFMPSRKEWKKLTEGEIVK